MDLDLLFSDMMECPTCRGTKWDRSDPQKAICTRCGYASSVSGRHISLMPECLSDNNSVEAGWLEDEVRYAAHEEYMIQKPKNEPKVCQEWILQNTVRIAEAAQGLGSEPSVLFTFSGGGMEAHLSGLLGPNVVLSDISAEVHRLAEKRFDFYKVPQPAAFVSCDAENLPFRDRSFDLVVGYLGIHHCLVPQAALQSIWRVARRRALVVDNYECSLTRLMFAAGKSSSVEYTGVKPNRFTRNSLETLMYNANVKDYQFRHHVELPAWVHRRVGVTLSRCFKGVLETLGQSNMFVLQTEH